MPCDPSIMIIEKTQSGGIDIHDVIVFIEDHNAIPCLVEDDVARDWRYSQQLITEQGVSDQNSGERHGNGGEVQEP